MADLAKVSPHVLDPARFALHVAVHLLARYAHLSSAFVTVEQLRWARIGVTAKGADEATAGHKHAFWRDGAEKRFVEVELARKGDGDGAVARVAAGLRDLLGTQTVFLYFFTSFWWVHGMDLTARWFGVIFL